MTRGSYATKVMSQAHLSPEELAEGTVLACRIMPSSDLCLQVIGKMKKSVCRTARAAAADAETAERPPPTQH